MVTVNISRRAEREIDHLDAPVKLEVSARLEQIRHGTRAVELKPLRGDLKNHMRVRVGDWRILLRVEEGAFTVVSVFHRSKGYTERDMKEPKMVLVSRDFVRNALAGKRSRNFASEYIQRSLGKDLRAARLHAGFAQKELAARIGRAQSTVSMAEAGTIAVSKAYVLDVLEACGLPRSWSRFKRS